MICRDIMFKYLKKHPLDDLSMLKELHQMPELELQILFIKNYINFDRIKKKTYEFFNKQIWNL